METQTNVRVDLSDPQDIRSKLPDVRALYEAKRRDLAHLQQEVEYWGQLVQYLSGIAGEPVEARPARSSGKAAPAQDAVVEALTKLGQPAGPAALFRFMVGNGLERFAKSPNQVGASLWAAHNAGRVPKTSDGLYAPPGWKGQDRENLLSPPNGASPDAAGGEAES